MPRVILIVAAVLAAVVLAVAAVGWLLPRDHVASLSATFRARPEAVFARIASLEVAKQDDVPIALVEQRAPGRVVTRIADPNLPFGGTWTFELTPEGGGTRVTITERGYVTNPIFRAVSRFVIGHEASMAAYLRELAVQLRESTP